MNFSNEESFKWGVRKGLKSAQKYLSDKLIIFTSESGKEYLLKQKLCSKKDLHVVDYGEFDQRFWNWPKLVAYKTITDSGFYKSRGFLPSDKFVHFDIADFFFEEDVPEFESDILTERIRNAQLFVHQFSWLGEDLVKNYWPKIITSGCLGGRLGDPIWKELYEYSKPFVQPENSNKYQDVNFEMLVGIEELVLTYLSRKKGRSYKAMNRSSFTHLQGAIKNKLVNGKEEELLVERKEKKNSLTAAVVI